MMRKVLLTVALLGLLAVPVCAQFGFGFGGGMDATQLLGQKSVQEELKLTDEQKKMIKEADDARTKAFAKAREDMDREGFRTAFEEHTKAMKKVVEKLDAKQAKRLFQIEVQIATKGNSPRIFANADVQKALKLTPKQKELAKETLSELEKDAKEVMEDAKGDFQKFGAAMKKIQGLGKDAFEKVTKSLDADQKKTWEALGGDKFEGEIVNPFGKGKGKKDKKKDDF
jgi:hypothetical protein